VARDDMLLDATYSSKQVKRVIPTTIIGFPNHPV